MKKIIRLVLISLIIALCASCAKAPANIPDKAPVLVQEEVPKADESADIEEKTATKPLPEKEIVQSAEENNPSITEKVPTCTLEVRCDTILKNMDKLHPSKKDFVPENGIIFSKSGVAFEEGESAFDVLLREMRKSGIHMEFVNTPGLGSSYVEGISNIYEFDCGPTSGWMYTVNGQFPGKGSSAYILKDGDKLSFMYTLEQGKDIGGYVGG